MSSPDRAQVSPGEHSPAANREQLERARREPWLLDDATVDRVKKVFGVQRDDMWVWEER